jgi:hypothetical protein
MSSSLWLVTRDIPAVDAEGGDAYAHVRGETVLVLSYGKILGFPDLPATDVAVLAETYSVVPGSALDPIDGNWRQEDGKRYFILEARGAVIPHLDTVALLEIGSDDEAEEHPLDQLLADLGLTLPTLNAAFRAKENDADFPGDLVLCLDGNGMWSMANVFAAAE